MLRPRLKALKRAIFRHLTKSVKNGLCCIHFLCLFGIFSAPEKGLKNTRLAIQSFARIDPPKRAPKKPQNCCSRNPRPRAREVRRTRPAARQAPSSEVPRGGGGPPSPGTPPPRGGGPPAPSSNLPQAHSVALNCNVVQRRPRRGRLLKARLRKAKSCLLSTGVATARLCFLDGDSIGPPKEGLVRGYAPPHGERRERSTGKFRSAWV